MTFNLYTMNINVQAICSYYEDVKKTFEQKLTAACFIPLLSFFFLVFIYHTKKFEKFENKQRMCINDFSFSLICCISSPFCVCCSQLLLQFHLWFCRIKPFVFYAYFASLLSCYHQIIMGTFSLCYIRSICLQL